MASCETTHWTLDCGAGHGCYLAEDSATGELLGWGCQSESVKGRRRPGENQPTYLDVMIKITFCCHDMTLAGLAEALDDLSAAELVVPKGRHRERISLSTTATMDDIIRATGLSQKRAGV